ncbi:MAG: hypothetical protein FWC13_05255 [Oscillospiraceae bacterium]|nr:hypothetical protein [Oscillospiraceae bacterium]
MSKKAIVCACPDCDQVIDAGGMTFLTQEDADNHATLNCSCMKAKIKASDIKALEVTEELLAKALGGEDGTENVELREMLLEAAKIILRYKIDSCVVQKGTVKVQLKKGTKSKIDIERIDTTKQTFAVRH